MKIMAVDYGDARTGLAVCDRTETLASPVGVIHEKSIAKVAEKIIHASKEFEAGMIVIGLPLNMNGSEGPRAEKTRRLGSIIQSITNIPVEYQDERQTSKAADAILGENGSFGKKRKEKQDAVAAALILETFLGRRNSPAAPSSQAQQ